MPELNKNRLIIDSFHVSREQFRDVCALATKHFGIVLEILFSKIFVGMMENGSLGRADPAMLTFAYAAPISTLVQLCDREPELYEEAMKKSKHLSNTSSAPAECRADKTAKPKGVRHESVSLLQQKINHCLFHQCDLPVRRGGISHL